MARSRSALLLLTGVLSACLGTYQPLGDGSSTGTTGTTGTTLGTTLDDSTAAGSSSGSSSTTGGSSSTADPGTTTDAPTCICDEIDILFIVDRRSSLNQYVGNITGALLQSSEVIPETLGRLCSFHMGLTTTSVVPQNGPECAGVGSLVQGDRECNALLGGRAFITEQDDASDALTCIIDIPHPPDPETDNSRPMEALLGALSEEANAPGGCNEGFFRPGAPLVVLLVTDQDDDLPNSPDGYGSIGDPITWGLELFLLQEETNTRTAMSMAVGPDPPEPGCNAQPATRLQSFLESFPEGLSHTTSICADASTLAEAYRIFFEELIPRACGEPV